MDLRNVTLVAASSDKIEETCLAMDRCLQHCVFGDVVLFSHRQTRHKTTITPMLTSKLEYNEFSMVGLPKHAFSTDFVLICQWDGWIINPGAWTDDFFESDYIGAPWPGGRDDCPKSVGGLVGNSGFNLRSQSFLEAQRRIFRFKTPLYNDDVEMCVIRRKEFEAQGVRFADVATGYRFSVELGTDEQRRKSFGFHGFHGVNASLKP